MSPKPLSRRKLAGMTLVRGGSFVMGSDIYYPEEAPRRTVSVGSFWIDTHPVTNRAFAEFVAATGHVTLAETAPDPRDYPGMDLALAHPGSAVFTPLDEPTEPDDPAKWWRFEFGANWRQPTGPGSTIADLLDHPVVHVAYADALAFAAWSGKTLPTEEEWEFAANGGLVDGEFAWGDELAPGGRMMANYWQGAFPWVNSMEDGYLRTSPVGAYPANARGLYDMIGNVWEWTCSPFDRPGKACCTPSGADNQAVMTLKGGSHLCAETYCQRYRPAARHPQPADSPTSHIGFRCIVRR